MNDCALLALFQTFHSFFFHIIFFSSGLLCMYSVCSLSHTHISFPLAIIRDVSLMIESGNIVETKDAICPIC